MEIEKIYMHWSATPYHWCNPGHYQKVVSGEGKVYHLNQWSDYLPEHTYARNDNSTSIALACMGGRGWKDYPPTPEQIEAMCLEIAKLCKKLEWTKDQITIQRIMTHAEAAANKDYPIRLAQKVSGWHAPWSTWQEREYLNKARLLGLPHENYGPTRWYDGWPGGFADRWDLWQLRPNDKGGIGGTILRNKIAWYFKQLG